VHLYENPTVVGFLYEFNSRKIFMQRSDLLYVAGISSFYIFFISAWGDREFLDTAPYTAVSRAGQSVEM